MTHGQPSFFKSLCPSGRVVAFEPDPEARSLLEYHVEMNGISHRVTIVPSGWARTRAQLPRVRPELSMSRLNASEHPTS
jgi:hypothetical protein